MTFNGKPAHGRRPKPKARSANVMGKMTASERASVLEALLKRHPELRSEAEQIAVDMISSPSVEEVAEEVRHAVTALGVDSLNGRAGRQPWGHVDPSEAAWELLGEAVEGFLADMKRCIGLGLHGAAVDVCCGVVLGLHQAGESGSEGVLEWAPDFAAETAGHAVETLIRACPAGERAAARDRLVEAVGRQVPEWEWMVERAATGAMRKR